MNDWDRLRQDKNYKQKLQNTKSTLPKIIYSNNSSVQKKKLESMARNLNLYLPQNKSSNRQNQYQNDKPNQFQKQNQLKHVLNEFGLSQYLRKIYELGYDDNNYTKIGLLSRREFDEFVRNIHLYPGQMVKMESFYCHLKQVNINKQNYLSNNYINKPKSSSGMKRSSNHNNLNGNFVRPNTTNIFNNKNKNNTQRNFNIYSNSNNKMVNSFANGEFGLNFYLNDNNNNYYNHTEGNNNNNNNYINKFNTQLYDNKLRNNNNINNNNNNNNIYNNNNINNNNNNINNKNLNEEEIEEKMNNDVERMLKYYMTQLNDKLDDSYKSIEDSTLSNINITSSLNNIDLSKFENENLKNKNINNINNNNTNNITNVTSSNNSVVNTMIGKKPNKLPVIKKNNDIDKNNNNNEIINLTNKENKRQKIELKPIEKKDNKNINEDENEKPHIIKSQEKQRPKIKISEKKNEEKKIEKNLKKEEEIKEEEIKNEEIKNEEIINENIEKDENPKNQIQNLNEENNKNTELEYIKDEEIEENIEKKTNEIPKRAKYSLNENYEREIKNENIEEKYTKEQQIYDNIRLTKSSEGDYIHQNTEQFDIEYMCRCLGLAIMKHLENGKGKQHICDLMNLKENFSFFNSLYNSNMDFLFNFFDKNKNFSEEEISNLDKLENKLNNENKNYINNIDKLFINDKPISYVHHFKTKNDDELIKESNKSKLHGIQEIEKDIKFIDEFFSMGKKQMKNYQNISEKSKNVLIKDLSYIGEVDSELQYSKINGSKINASNINTNKNEESKNEDNKKENDDNEESKYDEFEYMENEEVDEKNKRLSDSNDEKNNDKKTENEEKDNKVDKKSENDDNEIDKKSENKEEDNKIDKKSEDEEEDKKSENKDNEIDKSENDNNEIDKKSENENNEIDKKSENENNEIDKKSENEEESIKNKDKKSENNKKTQNENPIESQSQENSLKYSSLPKNEIPSQITEQIREQIPLDEPEKEQFQSGTMESDYIIDASSIEKLKSYLLKQIEIFDDDYNYISDHIPIRKYVPPPDPQTIFEFCANIMILTKMEKEVIIISLIYLERFIFNTGLLLTSRNWRRLSFIIMVIASKIWDDDSFENNHFAQVFTHLKIGEINLMERTFLELINYKTYIKCSEYFKYFFIIKSIALKYNYNGNMLVPISVEKMMKIQEYAYIMQKKMKKKYSLNNSAQF